MKKLFCFALIGCGALAGCASSTQIVTGTVRSAIAPSDVKLYSVPPPRFEEVAILDASSDSVFRVGGQKAVDKVVDRLKIKAAKLGANGLVLEDFSDTQTGSVGTGVGSDSYSRSSSVGIGVGGSLGIFKKTGKARAIYLSPQ